MYVWFYANTTAGHCLFHVGLCDAQPSSKDGIRHIHAPPIPSDQLYLQLLLL